MVVQDSADWFRSVDHPGDGTPPPQVPYEAGGSSRDSPRPTGDGRAVAADRAGSWIGGGGAAAADGDAPRGRLWSSLRGRLLIVAVSVSMLASVVVLTAWICLRSVQSVAAVPPD